MRLGIRNVPVLLFADKLLDLTDDHLKMKCLQVNVHKSKVVVFNTRNDKCESKFWFKEVEIQIVLQIILDVLSK